ncbi:DUF3380 domain-containing protein [Oxalobacteraceae bacterium OM1]|nr:DUF3380 domain-containing protein [Oxalobacteraceae bacterium OM1]
MTMDPHRDLYTVKKDDTLWKIAKAHHTTVDELQKLNGITNPRALHEGQRIALHREAVGGFRVLLLDRDRNPIGELPYRLVACNKTYTGTTAKNGETRSIVTDSPFDMVHIWLQRNDGSWKMAASVLSGFGDKQTVLVSAHIVVNTKTEKHPDLPPNAQPDPKERGKPAHAKPTTQTPDKALGILPKQSKTPDGKPITTGEGDLLELDFLGGFNGEQIEDKDYDAAAKELGCEVEVIKAIAKQETGKLAALGIGAFDKLNRPTILYERHIFSRITGHAFDTNHPDLSSSQEYLAGTAKNTRGERYDDGNHYGMFSWQYKKLAKAIKLNKDAAIQACSWGKFQVLGTHFRLCGFSSPGDFAKAMCRNEKAHLSVMVAFCKGNKLLPTLKNRDWAAIARTYNGPKFKKNNYDKELEAHYKACREAAK